MLLTIFWSDTFGYYGFNPVCVCVCGGKAYLFIDYICGEQTLSHLFIFPYLMPRLSAASFLPLKLAIFLCVFMLFAVFLDAISL